MTIEVFAPAKINLALHVTGQNEAGHHLLDSLVVFADVGDRVRLTPSSSIALSLSGQFGAGLPADADNLVWRAAELSNGAAHIELEKNLPPASGIGGGSSDAAAVLRGMQALHQIEVSEADGLLLGADVPACMRARPLRMTGIGEKLENVDWPDMHAVLINPEHPVSTPIVFARLAKKNNPPMGVMDMSDPLNWLKRQRNDLQDPAIGLAPVIADVLEALIKAGAELARMSGSGATCFGVFGSNGDAQAAAQSIADENPDWWVKPTRLGAPNVSPVSG